MNKRKMGTVTIVVTGAILILVFLLILFTTLGHKQPQITLPKEPGSADVTMPGESGGGENPVTRVEVTPDTVQNVIATLKRPDRYWRTITITTYWSGGSGVTTVNSYVYGDVIRMDAVLPGGQVRHTVRANGNAYLWYNSERSVSVLRAGAFSEDDEQWIPTYEDLLGEESSRIAEADYETYLDMDCIYAATAEDAYGYSIRYWVSVDSGLLIAAEQLQNGQIVYRMEASALTLGAPAETLFQLPDGTVLISEET